MAKRKCDMWIRIILILGCILLTMSSHALDYDNVRFNFITNVESQAITFLKDSDDFIWIGTLIDGVFRFDGKGLKHYTQASGMISGNNVPCIFEDRRGIIWFAASGGGLCKFDKESNKFTSYYHDPDDPTTISEDSFYWAGKQSIAEDEEGAIWVGTIGGGLNRFDRETVTFTHYLHDPDDPSSISNNNIRSVYVDREGVIWAGTENGLNRFDAATKEFKHYNHDPVDPGSLSGAIVTALREDREGILWVGTESHGLNRFDKSSGTFTHYRYNPKDKSTLGSDRVTYIYEDNSGILWLSHEVDLTFYDKENDVFTRYESDMPMITSVIQDGRTGHFLALFDTGHVGHYETGSNGFKLYRHDPDNPNSLASDIVVTIYEDSREMLWIACLGGLCSYDQKTGKFTRYVHEPGNPESIPSKNNYSPGIYEANDGTFWIGNAMPASICIFDRDSGKVIKDYCYDPDNPKSMPDATQVNFFHEDKDDPDLMWLATARGVIKFNRQSEEYTSIARDDSWNIHEDDHGNIYASSWGNGLLRYNKNNGELYYFKHDPEDPNSISANVTTAIFKASDGRIWIGAENGLNLFDPDSGTFTRYTRSEGYPWDSIHSIGEDKMGRLWLGSSSGLGRFDPSTNEFRLYSKEDGIQGKMFYALNGITTKDGQMWFGGTNGMNSFYPKDIVDNSVIPEIHLTSIKQGGNEMDFGKAPERLESIILDWNQNFFEFEFAAMNYVNPAKNQFAYMLEGLDTDWYYSETRNYGRYVGLQPGTYTLKLKGSNNDGVWNETGSSIKVQVLPPFWQTWWFFSLIIILIALIVLVVFYYMMRLRHEVAERKRSERELKKSHENLERLNTDLQRLDKLKDEFLANTSHELRTPLNGIIGIAESLIDGAAGALPPSVQENLTMITYSGRRLSNLVNDILDFSKMNHKDLQLHLHPVDLRAIVNVILMLSHPLAEGKKLSLENNIPPDLPPVLADEDRLQQILYNLIGNAIKFTERGKVLITASRTSVMS